MGAVPGATARRGARFLRHKNALLQSVEGMSANSWLELSGTNLGQLSEPDSGPNAKTRAQGLMSFSSGVWDPARRRFKCWGGGHNDYAGNEVYNLDLNHRKPTFGTWSRDTDPYVWPGETNTGDAEEIGTPTQPVGRHTYGNLAASGKWMVSIGGGALFSSAHGSNIVWKFHMDNKTWTKQTATSPGGDSQNAVAVTDSDRIVWYVRPGTDQQLHSYNVETDTLTAHTADWTYSFNSSAALRETASVKEMWVLSNGTMRKWDLNSPDTDPTTVTQTNAPYTGSHASHGFVYVPSTDRFIATSGGTNIATLNPNGTWTSQSPTGDTPESESGSFGTYQRFWCHEKLNRCFVFQTTSGNVFCYRPPSSY